MIYDGDQSPSLDVTKMNISLQWPWPWPWPWPCATVFYAFYAWCDLDRDSDRIETYLNTPVGQPTWNNLRKESKRIWAGQFGVGFALACIVSAPRPQQIRIWPYMHRTKFLTVYRRSWCLSVHASQTVNRTPTGERVKSIHIAGDLEELGHTLVQKTQRKSYPCKSVKENLFFS